MPNMIAVVFMCVISLLGLADTSPFEDDFRALKAEVDSLKSKTDQLDHNYIMLQMENTALKRSLHVLNEQKIQAVQQDLLFIQMEIRNLTNVTAISNKEISHLKTSNIDNDKKAMTKIRGLENKFDQENISIAGLSQGLSNLKNTLTAHDGSINTLQRTESSLKTLVNSHIQYYAALKNTVNAIQHEVHSTIAFEAVTYLFFHSSSPVIKFNQVSVNIGNAYNPTTGRFTSPKDGLYRFTSAINGGKENQLHFMHNGNKLTSFGSGMSISTILRLRRGDAVWVGAEQNILIVGSYSGYLI